MTHPTPPNTEYGLIVAFPDGSPSFVHGFEAGRIDQQMIDGVPEFELTTHTENEELFQRMAVAMGYEFTFEKTEYPEWQFSKFRKVAEPKTNNPYGLRVVK